MQPNSQLLNTAHPDANVAAQMARQRETYAKKLYVVVTELGVFVPVQPFVLLL